MSKLEIIAWKLSVLTVQILIAVVTVMIWQTSLGRITEAVLIGTSVIGIVGVYLEIVDYLKR